MQGTPISIKVYIILNKILSLAGWLTELKNNIIRKKRYWLEPQFSYFFYVHSQISEKR